MRVVTSTQNHVKYMPQVEQVKDDNLFFRSPDNEVTQIIWKKD